MVCCHSQSGNCKTQAVVATVIGIAAVGAAVYYYKYWSKSRGIRSKNGLLKSKEDESRKVKLIKKEKLTHDVRLFRWKLDEDQTLGLLPGEHVKLSSQINSKSVSRFYSPVSHPHQQGYFETITKIYGPTEDNPNAGLFSSFLDSLEIGSEISISGPFGQLGYLTRGNFLIKQKIKHFKTLAMIAGGSGLTPMLQLIRHILNEEEYPSKVYLIYTNKTSDDIIVDEELKLYAAKFPSRFYLTLVFTRQTENPQNIQQGLWNESYGRIDEGLLARVFPYPSDDVLTLICGPKSMNSAAKAICTSLGYSNINVF
ncbi:hypothetical protein FO519_006814 [Halicephalobus sp. NKZ332]|nr:hypothetical protein FO519_006814 [Halicephalobus sp. NKZ332]